MNNIIDREPIDSDNKGLIKIKIEPSTKNLINTEVLDKADGSDDSNSNILTGLSFQPHVPAGNLKTNPRERSNQAYGPMCPTSNESNLQTTTESTLPFKSCDKAFSGGGRPAENHKGALKFHQRIRKKLYPCTRCGKAFTGIPRLRRHMAGCSHGKLFLCSICNKVFYHKNGFRSHLLVHKKPFTCNVCNQGYSCKSQLEIHLRVHSREKPFSCNVCRKKFSQRGSLTYHLRIHSGETPFLCCFCDSTFTTKFNLQSHLRIHTGERPFACDHCDKTYKDKSGLTSHLKKLEEKLLNCHLCDQSFKNGRALKTHLKVIHPETIVIHEKLYSCKHCDKTFPRKYDMFRHELIHRVVAPVSPNCADS